MAPHRSAWHDSALDDVRPYTITAGRTRPKYALQLTSMLSPGPATGLADIGPEAEAMRLLCLISPRSIVELAGLRSQLVQITKVLVCDLLDHGALVLTAPADIAPHEDNHLLEAVVAGLRRLA
ncbi:DUF742 domain-containing protein [Streptomyces sp. BE133]|uniref:DUF742 domain-containing protein n=1 Tax=Streptomyces sp. BE133 TaxID=3002523 RepID=UPI002E78FEA5|nr:DUF742 domain-containing protein [Streptomyces sp. BE133]MEE1807643.1 DUF742 domain-containing protein [Streptomyces sp. BE133]